MLGQILSMGVDLATLPARVTWRGARAVGMSPARFQRFTAELRAASDEAAREIQAVLASVDAEMEGRAGHLSPEQKIQAAALALDAAEHHLSMAAVNLLRALWLGSRAARESAASGGNVIEHDPASPARRRRD